MRIETRHSKAAAAAAAWEHQYGGDMQGKAAAIRALGPSPSPEAVDRIIGNDSWTECQCEECGAIVEMVVSFGDSLKEYPAWVCGRCLARAAGMMAEKMEPSGMEADPKSPASPEEACPTEPNG